MENTPTALSDRRTRIGRTGSGTASGAPARRTMGAYTAAPMSSWISRSGTILIRRRRIVLHRVADAPTRCGGHEHRVPDQELQEPHVPETQLGRHEERAGGDAREGDVLAPGRPLSQDRVREHDREE